jgi:hypothetical protein
VSSNVTEDGPIRPKHVAGKNRMVHLYYELCTRKDTKTLACKFGLKSLSATPVVRVHPQAAGPVNVAHRSGSFQRESKGRKYAGDDRVNTIIQNQNMKYMVKHMKADIAIMLG